MDSRATELAEFLSDLSQAQGELLALLAEKRARLLESDLAALAEMQSREEALLARLQSCHDRRLEMLKTAADDGRQADSIRTLAGALPSPRREEIGKQVKSATSQARLLRHAALTQWVLAQRTVLHLSQMLEIIATGGRLRPTYGKSDAAEACGALVDRAA